ncbi:MAG TPA: glycosyl hydrolase [Longimicrobiales bacterium]|nr:glycosyl hydrolase [Longimicrobiales bacterium]
MRHTTDHGTTRVGFAAGVLLAAVLTLPPSLRAAEPAANSSSVSPAAHLPMIPTPIGDVPDSTRAAEAAAVPFFTGAFLGDARSNPEEIAAAIDDFSRLTGDRPSLVKTFLRLGDDFSRRGWPGRVVRSIQASGATNFIALDLGGVRHGPEGLLAALAGGSADAAIRDAARGLGEIQGVVLVELGWEMNGDWDYGWQGAANGANLDAPGRFVAAWRRIVDIFRAEGAANVRFVFSPNTGNPTAGAPADDTHWNWYGHYYPGDAYVDFLGIHGFNGPSVWGGPDRGFDRLFDGREMGAMLSDMESRFAKPIIIGELATQESGDASKAAWIEAAYRNMLENPAVVGAVWFHMKKEADWRVDSSPESLAAYRRAVSSPRVAGTFQDVAAAVPVRLASR